MDKLWCDVVPMSACHLLLGRSWQFDRKVSHKGDTNVYTMTSHSKKIKLHPLPPQITPKARKESKSSMFLSAKEIEKEIAEEGVGYALFIRHSQTLISKPTSITLQELMEEFGDAFPDELPQGLPTMRGIEHAIDLLPGAPLPNKPAYRCNHDDSKELQRQIEELIERGYLEEV